MARTLSDAAIITGTVVLLIAGAIVGFFIAKISPQKQYPDERPTVTVVLARDPSSGQCTPTDPEQLRRKGKNPITWHIRNTCPTAVYVKMDNFVQKNADGNGSPAPNKENILNPPIPLISVPAPQTAGGEGTIDLTATITKGDYGGKPELSYKYNIYVGLDGTTWPVHIDPDIDIWP